MDTGSRHETKVGVRGTLGSNEAELPTLSVTGTFRDEVKLDAAASELGIAANEDNSALNAAPWSSGS
ncbi:hypothetical protein PPTG_07834 [Phytophthora nicotianae INRA-310]|uniref:Uncharacterized protein n=1 Tax=Phytophthora nicotianae (strain INRA-310) TaxID=761204 RepID=W2QM19_PHYN3|nr:hypothetical protein PPTG_07834 [Phytophthora nicotianae INRA-310]ETN14183.1 hypothetical protein PPTG_07834 [Phytophthora nicotianae INRA-310]